MEALLLYSGKVILTSGVMFLYYQLSLKDRTFHHYNRFYLLGTMLISLLLPLLKLSYFTVEVNSDIYLLLNKLTYTNENKTLSHDFGYIQICALVAGLVSVGLLLRFLLALVRIEQFKKRYPKKSFEGIGFYQTDIAEAPFSFFRNLFWKESLPISSDLGRQILKHEMVHIEQKHSWDRVFSEILVAIFWFNPFFHLIKREIALIHEYLADKKAITNSDTKVFAQMLLASRFSGRPLPATSPFLSSNLKKRLTMLKKPKTKYSYVRRIAALPVVFMLCFVYLINAKNRQIETTNAQIEQYFSEIKKDTLLPPPPPPAVPNSPSHEDVPKDLDKIEKELQAKSKDLQRKSEQVQKLSTEMQQKSAEMQKLAEKNLESSPEFKDLENRLSELDAKIKGELSGEEFAATREQIEARIKELTGGTIKFYDSEDFKNKIRDYEKHAAEMEKKVNSPAFKRHLRQMERRAKDIEKKVSSPEFQQRIREAELRAKEMQIKLDSPEFQQRLKDATQKAEEAARRSTEANLLRDIQQDVIYYLDGKTISKAEMDKIEPKNIESMHVYKKDGKGEIHIKSKN
ncbi:M56 family metallopeptidase [Kaistella rhinocerotis]|uniref:M56 family metallopeptidase n=1 Tax=Kaistella rhinocerotis TaxID=3026437 RepID=UPI0025569E91|nr:M56 family metallopeptidase [Kaistella sp. Ran72]